jgi:hypothetical protein
MEKRRGKLLTFDFERMPLEPSILAALREGEVLLKL